MSKGENNIVQKEAFFFLPWSHDVFQLMHDLICFLLLIIIDEHIEKERSEKKKKKNTGREIISQTKSQHREHWNIKSLVVQNSMNC